MDTLRQLLEVGNGEKLAHESDYYEALGRLVSSFADGEAGAHFLIRKLSGLSDERARVIFGGMRFSDLAERLRALAKTAAPDDFDLIDELLIRLGAIGDERHKIAHRSTSFSYEKGFSIHNVWVAKSLEHADNEKVELSRLKGLASDCNKVFLTFAMLSMKPEARSRAGLKLMELATPWLCTPPQLEKKKAKKRGAPRLAKRQRHPSP